MRRLRRLGPGAVARRARRLMPQGELVRGIMTLALGTAMGQGLVVLSSPILTRLYSPSDVGALRVFLSIVAVLVTITCLSYDGAIPLPEDDVAAANVLVLALVINGAMTLACAGLLFVAGPALLAGLGASVLVPYVLLLTIGQFTGGLIRAFSGWAIRYKRFGVLASTQVVQSVTLVSIQTVMGALRLGSLGLLSADVARGLIGSAGLAWRAWRSDAHVFRRASRGQVIAALVRFRRFPLYSTGSALVNTLGGQAPLLLLVALYGTGLGGQYYLAERVGALPLMLVANSVGDVFLAQAALLSREHPERLRGLFVRATSSLARAAVVPLVLLVVAAPLLAGPVLGDEWRQAGVFAAILAPMLYLQLVVSPTGGLLGVLERQDLHLARELLRLCLVGGAVALAAAMRLPAEHAVIALSVAGCVTYGAYGLITWRALIGHSARLPSSAAPTAGDASDDQRQH